MTDIRLRQRCCIGLILCAMIGSMFYVGTVSAQVPTELDRQTDAFRGVNGAGLREPLDPRLIAARLIKGTLGVLGTAFLIYLIFGGYIMMTSQGNQDKVDKAKKTIVYATIGIGLMLGAYAITILVSTVLTGDEAGQGSSSRILPNNNFNPDPLRVPQEPIF